MFVALGSNVGDKLAALARARGHLASLPETRVVAASNVFVTAPVGGPEQDSYLNQVVELSTSLSPQELLRLLLQIEAKEGRVRTVRWGPRTLDLDILWYDGFSSDDAGLTIPHPRMEERRFVLEPLAELAPDLVLPSGKTVRQALLQVREQEVAVLDIPDTGDPVA
ncbi:MAG: 2-amino-4-hydroxy-6-hydroxymethyldihydropteridine diphosphokinase [Thermoleophilia bacterium]|nr:2-amino-4-hydroxy-6-hydroxymethyldihydropteridine diphosphokinase [Thermoleophilia bacterium]